PSFMPPEQAGGDPSKVGTHSDVYSLGAIAYTLLSGRPPFDEGAPMKTIMRVISADPPPPLRSLRPEVPPALQKMVMHCLENRPGARSPSARRRANDLRRFGATLQKGGSSAALPAARLTVPVLVLVGEDNRKVRLTAGKTTIGRANDCGVVVKSS